MAGIRDSEVHKDIYTVSDEAAKPDTGIESLLGTLEGAFGNARKFLLDTHNILHKRVTLSKEQWSGLG